MAFPGVSDDAPGLTDDDGLAVPVLAPYLQGDPLSIVNGISSGHARLGLDRVVNEYTLRDFGIHDAAPVPIRAEKRDHQFQKYAFGLRAGRDN